MIPYPIVWEAIQRLELLGCKVLTIICDEASSNRSFLRIHSTKNSSEAQEQLAYTTRNPFSDYVEYPVQYLVKSFCEIGQYLLSIPEVNSLLSNQICCQNILEQFFGKQRQQRETNDNPNVEQFEYNTSSIRAMSSVALALVHGNTVRFSRRRRPGDLAVDKESTPLHKRPRLCAKALF